MDEKLDNIINDARRIALTADEKAAGREMLRSYMALTPMRAAVEPTRSAKPSFRFALFGRAAGVAGLVSTLLASAAGVSYAAEGSLPGDALYPVKVGINEEVRVALASSEEEKAKVEVERAERRLAEAEALAKKGALKAETRVALERQFKAHSEKAKKRVEKSGPSVDAGAAVEIATHIESALNAHGKIIAAMEAEDDEAETAKEDDKDGDRKSRREEKKREVAALAATIRTAAQDAAEERGKNAEAREKRKAAEIAAKAEARADEKRRNAERRRDAVEKKINDVRAYLVKMRGKLGEEATKEAEQRLIVAEGVVGEGNAKLAAGDADAAVDAYVRAQRIAQEAKPLIRARGDLKVKVRLDVGDDESRDERRERDRSRQEDRTGAEKIDRGDAKVDGSVDLKIGEKAGLDADLDIRFGR